MSKISNLKAATYLQPFKTAVGGLFDKLCNDADSFIGSLENSIITTSTDWTVGTKGRLVSKEGNTLQLPLNSSMSSLIMFGLQLTRISKAGSTDEPAYNMVVEAELPAVCREWFKAYQDKAAAKKAEKA